MYILLSLASFAWHIVFESMLWSVSIVRSFSLLYSVPLHKQGVFSSSNILLCRFFSLTLESLQHLCGKSVSCPRVSLLVYFFSRFRRVSLCKLSASTPTAAQCILKSHSISPQVYISLSKSI